MNEKVRHWDDSVIGVGGTRKLRLRVPSPVARLDRAAVHKDVLGCAKQIED
jgi:hypothetical protein